MKPKTAAPRGVKKAADTQKVEGSSEEQVISEPEEHHPEIESEQSEVEESQEVVVEREREGSATTSATLVETVPAAQEPEELEILEKAVVHDEPVEHEHEEDEAAVTHEETAPEASAEDVAAVEEADVEAEVEELESVDPATTSHAPDVFAAEHQDDLHDIINMLEAKPLISSQLAAETTPAPAKSLHVDIDEIPDIDED